MKVRALFLLWEKGPGRGKSHSGSGFFGTVSKSVKKWKFPAPAGGELLFCARG